MVAASDIRRINELYGEYDAIGRAIRNIDAGGRIVAIGFGPPNSQEGGHIAMVGAAYMQHPTQMMAGIVQQLKGRLEEIEDELGDLGVTLDKKESH